MTAGLAAQKPGLETWTAEAGYDDALVSPWFTTDAGSDSYLKSEADLCAATAGFDLGGRLQSDSVIDLALLVYRSRCVLDTRWALPEEPHVVQL